MNGPRWYRPALLALVVIHAALVVGVIESSFVVVDEIGHVAAGLAHWRTGAFDAYRVNPPLGRMIAALPMLAARPIVADRQAPGAPGERVEWRDGLDLARANAARYVRLVRLARLPGVAWSALGLLLVARWARELYGPAAGLFGAALWCFDPTIMTFAAVVTPDVPAAVAGLAATYVFWHEVRRPSLRLAWLSGLLLGVAELTKFTMLVFYGIWPVLWLMRRRDPAMPPANGRLHFAIIVFSSLIVINAGYGFRGTCRRLEDFPFVSRLFAGEPPGDAYLYEDGRSGNRFRGSSLGAVIIPLPSDYVAGIDAQRRDFEAGFPSYLAGRWRHRGWWYYYLYALAVKVPLGSIALVLWGLILVATRHAAAARASAEATLLIPAIVLLTFVSSQSGFNHHMRYVLPIFPFLIISTAKVGYFFGRRRRAAGVLALAFLGSSAASVLGVYPHTMSYFNEAAGGPEHGADHLLDSNMDWGQDLLALKRWLDDHPGARPLGLAYFNFLDPRIIGIDFSLPPPGPDGLFLGDHDHPMGLGPAPGYFAVSVSFLKGSEFYAPDGRGGLRSIPHGDYEYFRRFRPIARAGYSILIYHISPREAAAERRRLGLPPLSGM
ncbi:MAG TPA: glycosyltransferase family 39 protein [Isosphaeraceae bacterium]|jgi:4-amino-4-deoxy-L-arabinose transferase-like glycosyltransferase|nr:glycosyltransferase family 39 protein [Isosphaeraceae bacterium]